MAAILPLLASIMSLTGCQTPGFYQGQEGIKIDPDNAHKLAADLVPIVRATFNPATTVFVIPADLQRKAVGGALDEQLRHAGYAVAHDVKRKDTVPIGYEVDRFGDECVRLSLVAGEAFQVSRLYYLNDDGELEADSNYTAWCEAPRAPKRRRNDKMAKALVTDKPATVQFASMDERPAPGAAPQPVRPETTAPAQPTPAADPAPKPEPAAAPGAPAPVEPAAVTPPVPAPKAAGPEERNDEILLVPNKENVIEISPALFAMTESGAPNPFIQLYQPKTNSRELKLTVNGITLGPDPTAIINQKMYPLNADIEAFTVRDIKEHEVTLVLTNKDFIVLRIPMQPEPILIKYP